MDLLSFINKNEKKFRLILFIFGITPLLFLLFKYYDDALGINPFATISHNTGYFSLIFIILTLAITPSRRLLCRISILFNRKRGKRLSDWNFLIKSRRQLGLFGFFYASLHFLVYLIFDISWKFSYLLEDWNERAFIIYGFINFLMLLSLAVTSPLRVRKNMGKWWRKLHRLMYPISILAVLHFYLAAKSGDLRPINFSIICILILVYRMWISYTHKLKIHKDDGMEIYRK